MTKETLFGYYLADFKTLIAHRVGAIICGGSDQLIEYDTIPFKSDPNSVNDPYNNVGYIYCQVDSIDRDGNIHATEIESGETVEFEVKDLGETFGLVLRSIEDLTDEEMKEVYRLSPDISESIIGCYGKLRLLDEIKEGMITHFAIDYLRSIGIDCDGMIEKGWAAKAT